MTMARVSASLRLAPPLLLVVVLQLLSQSAVAERPGTCPTVRGNPWGDCHGRCLFDEFCPLDEKCCRNEDKNEKCCKWVIPASPVTEKPGTCPRLRFGTVGLCYEGCTDDESCPGDQKCCSNGCGHSCDDPVGVVGRVSRKPGLCPHVDSSILICPLIANLNTCQKDWECQGQNKCCSTGCANICQKPVKVGACPVNEYEILYLVSCSSDNDCSGNGKCCSLAYGARCVEPDPCSMVKAGSCPINNNLTRRKCLVYRHDCSLDADCPDNDKCCNFPCGSECVDPDKVNNDKEPL